MDQALSSLSSSSVKNLKRKTPSTKKKQADNKDELKVVLVTGGKWVAYNHPYKHAAMNYKGDIIVKHKLTLCRKNLTYECLKNQISSLGVSMDLFNIRLTYVLYVCMEVGGTRKQDLTVNLSPRDINVQFFLNAVDRGQIRKPIAIYHEPYDWRANFPHLDRNNLPPLYLPDSYYQIPQEPVAKEVEVVLYSGGSFSGFYPDLSYKEYRGDSVVKHSSFTLPLEKLTWNELKNQVRALDLPMDDTFMISYFRPYGADQASIRLDMNVDYNVRRFLELVGQLPKPVLMYHWKKT